MWWLETVVLLNNTPLFIQGLSCLTSRLFDFDFAARKVNAVNKWQVRKEITTAISSISVDKRSS